MRKRVVTAIVLVVLSLTSLVASALAAPRQDKVWICHGTASDSNPYVLIHVDPSAVPAHMGENPPPPGHGENNYPDVNLGPGPKSPRPDIDRCFTGGS